MRRATQAVVPLRSVDVEIVFEATRNALTFEPGVMDLPIVAADASMHEMFARQVEQALARDGDAAASGPGDFVDRVRLTLMKLLPQSNADADRTAAALDMSTRTLHRRLARTGVGFRELLDDVRSCVARNQLARGDITVTDLAFVLGYSDLTAFSRAFRRWTGASPAEFRATRRAP